MIHDYNEFNKFTSVLPALKNDEVYFFSLSARNKYLTPGEREFYNLGRTEMFGRTIVKEQTDFHFGMKKLYSNLDYKTTNNGKQIPLKCLVTYANINPSSMVKAYNLLQTEMNKEMFEINQALLHGNPPNFKGIKLLERKLLNCIQKSRGRRYFIDIDMDGISDALRVSFETQLDSSIIFHTIKTQGGYHIIIKSDTIPNGFNLGKLVTQFHNMVKMDGGEVIFNKNQMVPVPGTMQNGTLVKIY